MNKLIQLALFFTLILTGCSNISTSSESKVETVKTTAAFPQKGLEKELKKTKTRFIRHEVGESTRY